MRFSFNLRHLAAIVPLLAATLAGCPACTPSAEHPEVVRPPRAQQWFDRALEKYRAVEIDEAHDSALQALELVPQDPEVKLLAARIALARLEYDRTLQLLKGGKGTEAAALRGRAHWYKGELEETVKELETVLSDPEVEDNWAKEIIKLAVDGAGARSPFTISTTNGRLETVQMAKVSGVKLFVVSVEIDGDKALAMISTGSSEVMIDSTARRDPSWVSLRFGERLEVKDVPALPKDLSDLSRRLGAPIKALIGAHLLRKLRVTLDHRGRQFVARSFDPAPPPVASRVDVHYMRGGGMVLGCGLGEDKPRMALFLDSSMGHSLALDEGGWKKAGIDVMKLPLLAGGGGEKIRSGSIPLLTLGTFKLPETPAVFGSMIPIKKVETELEVDLDGTLGAGVLADFRVTLTEEGRVMWLEQRPDIPPYQGPVSPGPVPQVPGAQPGVIPLSPDGPGAQPPGPPNLLDPNADPNVEAPIDKSGGKK